MNKLKDILGIRGKLGGFTFYEMNGKTVVRALPVRKKKSKKEQYEDNVKAGRLEFAAAAQTCKHIRDVLKDLKHSMGAYVSGQLTAMLVKVMRLAEGDKGRLPLLMSKHGQLLEGFELNDKQPLKKWLGRKDVKVSMEDKELTVQFPHLPAEGKSGEYKERLVAAYVAVSDQHYHEKEKRYVTSVENDNYYTCIVRSPEGLQEKSAAGTLRLPVDRKKLKGKSVVVFAGVEMCQADGDGWVPVKGRGGLQVVRVIGV